MQEPENRSPRWIQPLYYVLDTSAGMTGEQMTNLNMAMRCVKDYLKGMDCYPKPDIRIAVLSYCNGNATWHSGEILERIEDFVWKDLPAAGSTVITPALRELERGLNQPELAKNPFCSAPVILFVSSGTPAADYPTASFEGSLHKLLENKWYQNINKCAIIQDSYERPVSFESPIHKEFTEIMEVEIIQTTRNVAEELWGKSCRMVLSNPLPETKNEWWEGTDLYPGMHIRLMNGDEITVEEKLGEGGRSVVCQVDWNGRKMALKWYKPFALDLKLWSSRESLEKLIGQGPPNGSFLWPVALTEWVGCTFGCIMELCPNGFYKLWEYLETKVHFASFKAITNAALSIVEAFRSMHRNGFCWHDLNDGAFLIEPKTGQIRICDYEDIAPCGIESGTWGVNHLMAPEVILEKNLPNAGSDAYSMATILFLLFTGGHPLEGKRALTLPSWDGELEKKLYGLNPLFIMDMWDCANAPDPRIQGHAIRQWDYLPQHMKDLFQKAFSQEALHNPSCRPTELEWIRELARFRGELFTCRCGNEVLIDQGGSTICECCHRPIRFNARLAFPDYAIPAVAGTRIYRAQMSDCGLDEAPEPVGIIQSDATDARRLCLKNKSSQTWAAHTPSGKAKQVAPGARIPMIPGIRFTVYDTEIKIEG